MTEKINKLVKELNSLLSKSFKDFEGLYIFGSYVNGQPAPESDLDIVIILDAKNKKMRWAVWEIVSKLEYDYGIVLDLHPMTRQELEKNYSFYNEVVNKGVFFNAA
ncbi:MAG: nucleotidyltransferase domain-containing protein [Endomicrobium sp.]|jgi:predicted nucleotidyltransferase|nr:nucleotidyltransferase domain-containing protein [Endomicrobium sp.]